MTKSNKSTHPIWQFFVSVRLSIFILLSLAATSVIGTLIPQNEPPMLYRQTFGEVLFRIFSLLNIFDMYHSWWFRFLLCLLTINISVCSINRLSSTWKIIFPKHPVFLHKRFQTSKYRQNWALTDSAENIKSIYAVWLSKRFNNVREEASGKGYLLFGEKGRWTRLGVYAVHLSVILMVTGGLIGSIFGFDGFVNIPEGESINSISLRNAADKIKLDFEIKCNDFDFTLYESGMPKEYRSSLSIIRDNQAVVQKDIRVNHPLRFEGINIFQSSYGKMPATNLTVTFTEKASGMIYHKDAVMGTPVTLPGDSGTLTVEDFRPKFSFRSVNLSNVFLCRLLPRQKKPSHIIIPSEFPRFDMMRGGDFIISISNTDFKYYTGLQVTKDPGVPIVYAGFLFMIIGCYVTFFMSHQKICIEVTAAEEKTGVTVSGISGKNKPVMNAIIQKISRQLKQLA